MRGTRQWPEAQRIFTLYLANIQHAHGNEWPVYLAKNIKTGRQAKRAGDNWQTVLMDLAGVHRGFIGQFTSEMITERDRPRTRKEYAGY